ncbi:YveK family protein [Salipaludibacillus daqingensis]|uniref:YveK family protein n=1 Tax=Salipaludibacillus daqingensis TaxID=3041001 RepID=UPI002474E90F|nr:Wzz/FepE/Etk N-terminal domain-containing protein [Salipaludibacillus daqingensis]
MEATLSIKDIINILKKRFWIILVIVFLAVAASAYISYYLLTPTYRASTQILVNQSQDEGSSYYSSGDLRTNLDLINTYKVIISSPRILEATLEELGLDRSPGSLNGQITVSNVGESQVVNISVIDESPSLAVDIANTLSLVFKEDIVDIMSVDNVSILSSAELSTNPSPVSPNTNLNITIAFVVSLMGGVGLVFLLEFLDNTIRTEEHVEDILGVPLLASISKIDVSKVKMDEIAQTRRAKTGRENYGA